MGDRCHRDLDVGGVGGVSYGATDVVMNVTAMNGTQGSFLTLHPYHTPSPTSSNVNFGWSDHPQPDDDPTQRLAAVDHNQLATST